MMSLGLQVCFFFKYHIFFILLTFLGTIYTTGTMEQQGVRNNRTTGWQGQRNERKEMTMTGVETQVCFFYVFYIYSINDFLQVD